MNRYNPKEIEPRWQKIWEETGVYTADLNSGKPKYIAMSMFNYPSGAGIHIGHAMNYTISDVKARFKRQLGFESYHPVGWDAFGLPAENYAIKAGVSPQESMATIIPDYHKQYKAMGWSNDWEKEISTHLPEYYKWTQWIFSQMYRHKLAYQDVRMQWWCTKCQTVLANEQVIDGKCWRHDGPEDLPVEKREVKQWFFKITDYADELLEAIDGLDWTESVKLAQRNWIGKSIGAEIDFKLQGSDKKITVFTTRPDTLFGATFMVIAPENEVLQDVVTDVQRAAVEEYIKVAAKKTEVERQSSKEKTGVFTGAYAVNPANDEAIPIWVADYVLAGYGTGAIMAVPGHDERDYEFAEKFNLPIVPVVAPAYGNGVSFGPVAKDREVANVILHDSKTDKYCLLNWREDAPRKAAGIDLPGGGVDEGETVEQGALREVREETGYTDVTITKVLPSTVAIFYTDHYDDGNTQLRRAVKHTALAELNTDAHNNFADVEDYEKGWYQVVWMSREEIVASNIWEGVKIFFDIAWGGGIYVGEGVMINSGKYDNLPSSEAREKIVADLEKLGAAKERTNYKMRDWSVSRQRYWGAPIPIVYCSKCGIQLVPDEDLPVILPELDDFQPSGDGRSALARAKDWLKVDCPECGGPAERETDTLDTYICSSWYMYRYFDPHNQQAIFDSQIVKKWEPIDFYNGADHATAHLLYARFIARFFKKLGLVNEPEPFKHFLFNGKVTAADGQMFSKSKGNGVDPLEIINQGYGADALRTYLMFASPLELWTRWDSQGVPGAYRFLNRLWNLVTEYCEAPDAVINESQQQAMRRMSHQTIKKVTEDLEADHYNTAIAASMAAVNSLYKFKKDGFGKHEVWQGALEALTACVAPFAPHLADELWHRLGHSTSVHIDTWPHYDEKYLASETMTIVVQINGKLRAELTVGRDTDEKTIVAAVLAHERVKPYIDGRTVKKTIYVPDKLVSIVISQP
jgi:leucyl-tRNA synthetase